MGKNSQVKKISTTTLTLKSITQRYQFCNCRSKIQCWEGQFSNNKSFKRIISWGEKFLTQICCVFLFCETNFNCQNTNISVMKPIFLSQKRSIQHNWGGLGAFIHRDPFCIHEKGDNLNARPVNKYFCPVILFFVQYGCWVKSNLFHVKN